MFKPVQLEPHCTEPPPNTFKLALPPHPPRVVGKRAVGILLECFLVVTCDYRLWHVEDVGDVILIFFECNAIYVEDRSNTPKGCNAMYVEDIADRKRIYTHIFAHNFLNIQLIFNLQKVLESWDLELFNHTVKYCVY